MRRAVLLSLCALVVVLAASSLPGCQEQTVTLPQATAPRLVVPVEAKIARGKIRFDDQYATAISQAQEQHKPVMLFFTAGWCRFCNQMAQDAFRQEPVVGLSDRFVCILVDADREKMLCEQFEVRSFPTIVFLSNQGLPVSRLTGKQPGHRLVMEMQSVLQTIARRADWMPYTLQR